MCTHVGSAPDIVGPFIFRLSTTCPNTLILRTDLPNTLTLSVSLADRDPRKDAHDEQRVRSVEDPCQSRSTLHA